MIFIFFFILMAGLAFHLRGIWGHQLGGAAMGCLIAFFLGIWYQISLILVLNLAFWLALAWAVGSLVGWANHEGVARFTRGYLAYGMLPNLIIAIFLFPANYTVWLQLVILGGMGMGIGFGLSSPLINWFQRRVTKSYQINQLSAPKLTFDETRQEGVVSHVYTVQFNGWAYLLEYPAGAWYGLTTGIILYINQQTILFPPNPIQLPPWSIGIMSFVIFGGLYFGWLADGFKRRHKQNPFQVPSHQSQSRRWSREKRNKLTLISAIGFTLFGLVLSFYVSQIPLYILFMSLMVYLFISSMLSREMDSKMMRIDLLVEISIGLILCICLFYFLL